jgi:uncharacterized protein (TIGR01777 family)
VLRGHPAGPRRVVVTGASGLIGGALVARLVGQGIQVDPLVRRTPRPGTTEIRWDPAGGEIDVAGLEGADAVVHLAGESIAAGRWTGARRNAIRRSRVEGTRLLAGALARLERRPAVLVSASAIGYYGDRGDEVLTENSPGGMGFLAEVAREWEAATQAASHGGIRVVVLRIGLVLAAKGGALPRMLLPFKLGLGGPLGSGRQYVSWIALEDLLDAIEFALTMPTLAGPVNAVAPGPVTSREFARILGRVLHRPAVLPVPALAIRLALGEMGQALLLAGARVVPARLEAAGFRFRHPGLEAALRRVLGRP